MARWKQIQLASMKMQVLPWPCSVGWGSGVCHELWYRSQTHLGSHVAVAVLQVALGPKKKNTTKQKKKR